jgi:hypothetical protein
MYTEILDKTLLLALSTTRSFTAAYPTATMIIIDSSLLIRTEAEAMISLLTVTVSSS